MKEWTIKDRFECYEKLVKKIDELKKTGELDKIIEAAVKKDIDKFVDIRDISKFGNE